MQRAFFLCDFAKTTAKSGDIKEKSQEILAIFRIMHKFADVKCEALVSLLLELN